MNLPKITDLDVTNKKVLLRLDLDIKNIDFEDLRIKSSNKTLDYLKDKASEIIIIAHRGRPTPDDATAGKPEFSLKPFQSYFDKWGARVEDNLRFDKGEEDNNPEFAKKLASLADVFVNDAFASSHRNHASIVGIPKLLPSAFGLHFLEELENLNKIFDPVRPLVTLISGVKEDKLLMIESLSNLSDKVLVGGRLPDLMGDKGLESVRLQEKNKIVIGNLIQDKEDITLNTIEVFTNEILKARTILLTGVLGKYEDEGHSQGTKKVFQAVANSKAFKIAGGGDTINAIYKYSLQDKFDWISVGGGATLEYLNKKTLPAIEAIKN